MLKSSIYVIKKQINFQEGEQCWLVPTTYPPTKLKPRMVYCQEAKDDEDITPSDKTIEYKMSSFLYLHSDFLV